MTRNESDPPSPRLRRAGPPKLHQERRRGQLALIHQAKKALGLDDSTYRDMLAHLTGERSAADLDEAGRDKVIQHVRRMGFRPMKGPRRAGAAVRRAVAALQDGGAKPQEALILGLWDELRRIGAFRRGGFARLDTWMHRQAVHVAHPRFCTPDQASKLIEALKAWLAREKRRRGLD